VPVAREPRRNGDESVWNYWAAAGWLRVRTIPPCDRRSGGRGRICRFPMSRLVAVMKTATQSEKFPHTTDTRIQVMPSAHATRNIAVCLWFDGNAEEAANFYARTFPDSRVGAVHRAPGDYPAGEEGNVLTVEFTVLGMPFLGLNGGPQFKFDEAVSFQVYTADQAETDRLWNAIVGNGGAESECGWCKDKFGLSWQITPRALMDAFTDPDPAAARRAFEAMMTMQKIDIAKIEAARRG
jgi:2-polyprenyl-6-hydroxyphenyl methylase/3-demethylubiquinone-9 3-methyltransferase